MRFASVTASGFLTLASTIANIASALLFLIMTFHFFSSLLAPNFCSPGIPAVFDGFMRWLDLVPFM